MTTIYGENRKAEEKMLFLFHDSFGFKERQREFIKDNEEAIR